MFIKKSLISFLVLAASLGVLLLILKTSMSGVLYHSSLAHSFMMLAFAGALFFISLFSYQNYAKEKDVKLYIVTLACFILLAFYSVHAVLVPEFGWGSEAFFDIFEHYGLFLASLVLCGIVIHFSDKTKEKIYSARIKILFTLSFLLLVGFVSLFFLPSFANVLFQNVNIFIGLTGIIFFILLLTLLTRKEENFFTTFFPIPLTFSIPLSILPFFYQEWNLIWWFEHLLLLTGALLLLLLLLRANKGQKIIEIPFSSFSIRTRLFFIVGLVLVAIVTNGLIDFRLSKNHLQAQTLENLVLMADLQEGQVLNYLDKLKDRTVDISSDGFINDSLEKILYGDKQAVTDLSRYLLEHKQSVDPNILGIHIMDINGKVVASSQGNEIGMDDMAMEEVFIQAKGSRYGNAFLSDIVEDHHFGERNIIIMATAPIIDQEIQQYLGEQEQERKENLGVIMLFYKTQGLSDILTGKAQTQSGALSTWTARKKTLEMYLVNEDKLMLSDSRFILNTPLEQKVDTVPVRLCAKSEEMSGEYLDYRGIPVFGASMCFANGWTLLVEIDKSELFATLGDYFQQNLLSASATLLLILFAMYLFTLGIISPLKELSAVAQKIGVGDFTVRTKFITRDEFGELGAVFNQMAENIQKGSAGLEQKAKEEETSRLAVTNILGDLEVAKGELEQAKAKDEAILTSIGDGMIITDNQGIINMINPSAEKMLGWNVKDLLGKSVFESIPMEDEKNEFIPSIRRALETALSGTTTTTTTTTNTTSSSKDSGKAVIATIYFIRKDKTKFPAAVTTAPIRSLDGSIIGVVAVFRDITKEKEVDKAKTEFVSLASHQLRTPLSTINWYAEMLLSGDAGKVNKNQKKYLEEAYKASKRMVALVNALLNVSRLEMGTFVVEPEPTDVVKLAQSVIDEQKPQIEVKKITLSEKHTDNLPMLNADPKLLRIVFQNLLSNAVKYTPEGGSVKLSLSSISAKGGSASGGKGQLSIAIADTGYGIPKGQQDKIFTKLFRADNVREKDTEGTGLGLYIVKSIIDHSGGKIWFESPSSAEASAGNKENPGTTFHITLPIAGMKKKEGTKALT